MRSWLSASNRVAIAKVSLRSPPSINAAVPYQPIHGPIGSGLIASVHPFGTRRPAAGHNLPPSESIRRTEEIISGEWASTLSHKSCKVSVSPAPPETNSRVRHSADKCDSRWASLEAWPASFPFGPLEAASAGSRLEDDAGALMNSPTVGLGSGNILRYSSKQPDATSSSKLPVQTAPA